MCRIRTQSASRERLSMRDGASRTVPPSEPTHTQRNSRSQIDTEESQDARTFECEFTRTPASSGRDVFSTSHKHPDSASNSITLHRPPRHEYWTSETEDSHARTTLLVLTCPPIPALASECNLLSTDSPQQTKQTSSTINANRKPLRSSV
jgi:hypothetical protein